MSWVGLEEGDEEEGGNKKSKKDKLVGHLINNDRSEVTY